MSVLGAETALRQVLAKFDQRVDADRRIGLHDSVSRDDFDRWTEAADGALKAAARADQEAAGMKALLHEVLSRFELEGEDGDLFYSAETDVKNFERWTEAAK
jgi:hypothetical protein